MSSNCNKCKIIPLTVKNPQSARFSDQLKRNTMKTVYQGQPTNILVTRILSDSAVIEFTQIGYPIHVLFELSSRGSVSNTFTVEGGHTKFQATGLMPGTSYEINVIVTYVSGDQFPVNHKKTFITLNKWKVPSVTYIYPRNRTIDVTQNFHYTAIDLSFGLSPGTPTQYIIQVDGDNPRTISSYYLKPLLYPIYIRNDFGSGSVVEVITEYNDDEGYNDVSFTHQDTLPLFLEGTSIIDSVIEQATFIDISFSKAPGNPIYHFYLRESQSDEYKTYQKLEYSNGIMRIFQTEFNRDTQYRLTIETYYAQTNNTYRNANPFSYTTFNNSPIQNVQCFATNNSLTFSYDSPAGEFLNDSNNYFTMSLRDNFGYDVSFNAQISKNTTQVMYTDLSINAAYTFEATSYYSSYDLSYSYERVDRTLYEGGVHSIAISNIQGTTVDISYESYTSLNIFPSIPDYYVIEYIELPQNNSDIIQTYDKDATLTNVLNPDTSYNFSVTAIYSSGNSYTVSGNSTIRTKNEGPVKSISVGTIKGDQIDLSWSLYDNIIPPTKFRIEIYRNMSTNKFADYVFVRSEEVTDLSIYYSYQQTFRNLFYASDYKFIFISEYSLGNIYSRSVFVTTANEYFVKLSLIIADSTSIEIRKYTETNNQDKYIFVRTPNANDIDSFSWVEQDVSSNTADIKPTYFAGENTTFNNIEMSKNGMYVLFCPNNTTIQIFKQFETTILIESSNVDQTLEDIQFYYSLMYTMTLEKPIYSMSINYTGNIFLVGCNDNKVHLYDLSYNETSVDVSGRSIMIHGTTSRSVVLSPSGNVFAVSNGELRDNIFIMDVINDISYNYLIPDLPFKNDTWFQTVFNKYVQFDNVGSIMTVGFELFYFPTEIGSKPTIKTYVKIFDLSNGVFSYSDRMMDISGTRISLNKAGTKLAVVDNYDISSNSTMFGSVSIYDIASTNISLLHKFWGSENIEYPMYRNCSINDNGKTVAIGEFKFSYKPTNSIDGQILVYEFSENSWSPKGFPIRQTGDVDPLVDSDTILTGEWLGYKLILDNSGNYLLTSTRPKINMSLSINQGKGYIYKWKNNDDIYKFNVQTWPIIVKNLTPSFEYNFRIYATYNRDPGYSYYVDISASTLSGQKPEVSYRISNNKIGLSWRSVTWDVSGYRYLRYTVTNGNTPKYVFPDEISNNYENNAPRFDVSYEIQDLNINTPYNITVASEFTRDIYDTRGVKDSTLQFIYKNERIVSTLNERASNLQNIVALNSDNLVVLDVENVGAQTDISQNRVTLNVRRYKNNVQIDLSYTFVTIPPSMVDIRQLEENDRVSYSVETTYKHQPILGVFTYNNSTYISYSRDDFIVSNIYEPDKLIQNGQFEPDTNSSYDQMLTFLNIRRFPVEIFKGIYRIIPPSWSEHSHFIVAIENRSDSMISAQRFLNVVDISYHAVLLRSEDLAPGSGINPANLTQELQGSVFARWYSISFFIRNQDTSSVIYDNLTGTLFTDEIKYQIEFADVLSNDYIFYKTSPIRNTNKEWLKFRCRLNFPSSHKQVKYTIRRLDKEENNLYISDVSMIFTNLKSDPYTFIDGSWNCLSTSPTPWKDIWTYDGSFQVIQLSCNMSISCWFYLHGTDVSQCIFLLGTDVANGTPGIYIDNSNIIVTNIYEDTSSNHILSTSSVLGVPTHFVVTYFNNTISTFMNGVQCHIVDVSQNTMREAHSNYNIYLGNPNEKTLGAVIKSVKVFDYQVDLSFISNVLYQPNKTIYQIGNPNDISNSRITGYLDSYYNGKEVTLPVLDNESLTKQVFMNSSLPDTRFSNDVRSVSMWMDTLSTLYVNNSLCTFSSTTMKTTLSFLGYQIQLQNEVNHFVITRDNLYMNGYLYLSDISPIITTISGSNLGEVITWNKVLSESNVLTSYYNYYHLYTTYDISGYYKIFVKYPRGMKESSRNVSYNFSSNPYTDASGQFYLSSQSDISYIVFTLDSFRLNAFNQTHDPFSIRLLDYNVVVDISVANVPYIQYNYSNIQYLTEDTTIDFWIENLPSNYPSLPYNINGGINSSRGDITGHDVSNSTNMTGMIGSSISKVSIVLKEDYTIEDMESLIFNVPSLNLSTLLYIYDQLYFTTDKRSPAYGEVFTIRLRNKKVTPNSIFNYRILGVSGEDISGANLSGTIQTKDVSNISTVDISLSTVDISFTVTTNKRNMPFKMMLIDDYSFVSISLWLNDYFNLIINTPDGRIREGEEFSFILRMPSYVQNNTSFLYTITGILADDLEYGDLSGYFIANDLSAQRDFKLKFNAEPAIMNKTLVITVMDVSSNTDSIASFSAQIIHVEPKFAFVDCPFQVSEGDTFTIKLLDLSNNLPRGTDVSYTIVYISSSSASTSSQLLGNVPSTDISANRGVFTMEDSSGTVILTAIADKKTEGGKIIQIRLDDFQYIYWNVFINDTSPFPVYDLSCNKSIVNEGEEFTVTLIYSNIPDGTVVPYVISGIGTPDILGLESLQGEFTIPDDISRNYTVRADRITEGTEKVEFRLTSATNPAVMVAVDISDSSQSPKYTIEITGTLDGAGNVGGEITSGSPFTIVLSTTNVQRGAMVEFSFDNLSFDDLSVMDSNSLSFSNDVYSGVFTVGSNESFSLTPTVTTNKTTSFSLSSLPFIYLNNNNNNEVVSQTIRFIP